MARILTPPCTPISTRNNSGDDSSSPPSSPKRWVSLLDAINVFFSKLRKQAGRGGVIMLSATKKKIQGGININIITDSPRSPLAKPKQLFVTLSNKAVHFRHKSNRDDSDNNNNNMKNNKKKKKAAGSKLGMEGDDDDDDDDEELDFGNGGLWQRNILMGDKCQPLAFSGVIYYDSNGKQLQEFPMKSPRASPLPSYLYAKSPEKY